LKQSGQLEQDAAVAFIVQRKDPDAEDSELVFKVAKNRYGRTGKTFFNWKGKFQRIEEKPNLMPTYNPANFTRKTSDTSNATF
jgi:replicative DNA helicase